MKNLLFTLLSLGICNSFAWQTVNLNKQAFMCNSTKVTPQIAESTIAANCKNVSQKNDKQITSGHNAGNLRGSDQISQDDPDPTIANLQKIRFTTDDGTKLRCYYDNSKLVKCKQKNKPQSKNKTASS